MTLVENKNYDDATPRFTTKDCSVHLNSHLKYHHSTINVSEMYGYKSV